MLHVERYRRGHNGPDSKSGDGQPSVGSNPTRSAMFHRSLSAVIFYAVFGILSHLLIKHKYKIDAIPHAEYNKEKALKGLVMEEKARSPLKIIAKIHSDFPTKFGLPRQSGLVQELCGKIVFEPSYRNPDALRGIEGYSHLWLIWGFSETDRDTWSPTVRPPRLGGNKRVGVFATRSPFRPNALGLSSVRLLGVDYDCPDAPVLLVSGADLLSGTPIYDVKPYLPYTDSRPEATGGFAAEVFDRALEVRFAEGAEEKLPEEKREALIGVLAQDPRPATQNDPERVYGVPFAGKDVKFTVRDGELTVEDIV